MNLQNEITAVMNAIKPRIANTPEQLLLMVCQKLGISTADIKGSKRTQDLVEARIVATQLIRNNTTLKDAEIADVLNRERTTVYYYLDMFEVVKRQKTGAQKIKLVNEIDVRLCEI
ncbi:helix-turn-helix domain-containing protein [Pedobacter arcticus]|uniref:helix-turn-helix domain-containing protein n=1 Tax=Pedobacter arcticus TaxID=752140 RepID=UPI000305FA18|nr:helix-turn-helix domain-containing protein [Pedobacter arcticus]